MLQLEILLEVHVLDLTVGNNNNNFEGENILWYDSADSQIPLSEDTILVDGTTYYISQTVNGCESIDRFEILVFSSSTDSYSK